MTQPPHPPTDPNVVAEVAPGEGPEAGSVEYGGSEIHSDGVGETATPTDGGVTPGAVTPAVTPAVTTEAGTFEDLPVTPDEQVE